MSRRERSRVGEPDSKRRRREEPESFGEVYAKAHERLQTFSAPLRLPCRDSERRMIRRFLRRSIAAGGSSSALYVSGMPGTGKTATVQSVIQELRVLRSKGEVGPFKAIEVNGMRLADPRRAYSAIHRAFEGASLLLSERFKTATPNPSGDVVVVVVDELDQLVTRQQTVLYNLFDWPNYPNARLVIVAIANTLDLPERLLPRIGSRLGMTRVSFSPYTHEQLETIVRDRLEGLDAFDPDAVELCARRIAGVSGDARRALEICQRACELAEKDFQAHDEDVLVQVNMLHIEKTVMEMRASPFILAVAEASLYEQIFLVAVCDVMRRSGLTESTLAEVAGQHRAICRLYGVPGPTLAKLSTVCSRLGSTRLLLVENSRQDILRRIRLCVDRDDVAFAVQHNSVLNSVMSCGACA